MKKIVFLIVFLLVLSTLPNLRIGKVEAAGRRLRVPQDYSTIQAAINASIPYDTIQVSPGTYNESPKIGSYNYSFDQNPEKNNIVITGESSSNTIITGSFEIGYPAGAEYIVVKNFDIKGYAKMGGMTIPSYIRFSNDILRQGIGIGASYTSIGYCIIYGNVTMSPHFTSVIHGMIGYNFVMSNTLYGGVIIDCVITGSAGGNAGNRIENNTFINAPVGVLEEDSGWAWFGDNEIVQNRFINCGTGVQVINHTPVLGPTQPNIGSIISGNTFEYCGYGVTFTRGNYAPNFNVSVYQNSFIDNTVQALADPSINNVWDNGYPSGGNYWSDYRGTDFYNGPNQNLAGSDGIGDTPYVININNTDRYPLMSFSDDFSSASNRRWVCLNAPTSLSLVWLDYLVLTPILMGTTFWSGVDTGQFMYQWMGGDFIVETKVSATLSANYQQAGLMIRQDANNWAKTCFEYSDGLTVKTVVNRNNAASVESITSVPTGTTVVWLRVVRNGDSYTAYYSFDGYVWTQHYSWTQPLQGTLMAGLCVADGYSNVAFQPSFDYFRYSNLAASSYSIQAEGLTFPCLVQSNSLVSSFTFNQQSKEIKFSVTGDSGTAGVCNVTFPTQLLGGQYTVLIDGSPRPATATYDSTHTSVYFTYSHSTHQVEVIGASVVPEFPTIVANTLVLIAMALMLFIIKRNLTQRR